MTKQQFHRFADIFWVEGASRRSATLADDGRFTAFIQIPNGDKHKLDALMSQVVPNVQSITEMRIDHDGIVLSGKLRPSAFRTSKRKGA